MAAKGVKITINERRLASLAKAAKTWPPGKRALIHDAVAPGAAVRAYSGGALSLGMVARFPLHPRNPTFRKIGDYAGAPSLAPWRNQVRAWLELIGRGIDPELDTARRRATEQQKHATSFATVWGAFEERHASRLSKAAEARRAGVAFAKMWGIRPAVEIEPAEIAAHIRSIASKAPAEARNRLGHLRRMYSWAAGAGGFGISSNPCAVLKPKDLIGAKRPRDRTLSDDELRRVWHACSGPAGVEALKEGRRRDRARETDQSLGFPYGPLFKFMLLTGQREREVAGASWSEIDLAAGLWVIPAVRMKADRAHVVPLAPDALALLRSLPRFTGPCVFTTTAGARAVNGFGATKARLDALSGVRGWVLHDLRRTMRSHLSALPIEDRVREQMIAHAQPGLHRVYDLYGYLPEKQRGFELWEAKLRGILAPPPPADVTELAAERARRVA